MGAISLSGPWRLLPSSSKLGRFAFRPTRCRFYLTSCKVFSTNDLAYFCPQSDSQREARFAIFVPDESQIFLKTKIQRQQQKNEVALI